MSLSLLPDQPRKGVPAYQQLAESIRAAIISGELKEGDRIPSESGLAHQAGVSRSTVREALRVLQESGFLERVSPRILVVCPYSEGPAVRAMTNALSRRTVTFATLHEALMLLEPELARLAAQRRDESDLADLRRIIDAQHRHRRDYAHWCVLDEEFHLAIAQASANAPLVLARAALGQVLVPTVAQFIHNEQATQAATQFHRRLYDEIAAGDAELAGLVARRHLEDFQAAWERSGLGYHRDVRDLIEAATEAARIEEIPHHH